MAAENSALPNCILKYIKIEKVILIYNSVLQFYCIFWSNIEMLLNSI